MPLMPETDVPKLSLWLPELTKTVGTPDESLYLIGHSAGAAVILGATQRLPANSVERIVLLAPGVSCRHDLRCALTASRCGIDNFFSRDDDFLIGCTALFGTTDGKDTRAAGELGFVPMTATKADAELYRKLCQHPWRAEYAEFGYYGGHLGVARKTFLAHAVVPMLKTP